MNEVTQREPSPLQSFKGNLTRMKEAGELPLPSTVPFANFKNAATIAVTDNPRLLQGDPQMLFKAIRTLAAAGLVPDGREAAIVEFKGKAQAMPMVSGLIKVARNSGKITSLWGDVVYEGETLDVWNEDGERKWDHVQENGDRINALNRGGKVIGAYAVAKLTDGTVEFMPMGLNDLEKRRKASPNQKSNDPTGIWQQWYEEMAIKTVIRSLCKRLPMSSDDMERIMQEQDPPEFKNVTPEDDETRPNLAQRIKSASDQSPPPKQDADTEGGDTHGAEEPPSDVEDAVVIDPESVEYGEGLIAQEDGRARAECPYMDDPVKLANWNAGWESGK